MSIAETRRKKIQAISYFLTFLNLIFISKLTGYQGVAYLMICMEVYLLISVVINGGVSDVLGRIIRVKKSKGQYISSELIRKYTFVYQMTMGILGMIILFIMGRYLITLIGDVKYCKFIIVFFAPLVFLRTISCFLSGAVKGQGTELPEALSVIIRQIIIFIMSMLFCNLLVEYGTKVSHLLRQPNFVSMYAGAGVMIAVITAELFVDLFLFLVYISNKKKNDKTIKDSFRTKESFGNSIRLIVGNRLPITVILLLLILPFPICLGISLSHVADLDLSLILYGVFFSDYIFVLGSFISLLVIPILSIIAKLYQNLKKNDKHYTKFVYQTGVHFILICNLFWVVFFAVMSEQFAVLLNKEYNAILQKMFTTGSSLVLTIALSLFFNWVLLLKGKKLFVIISLAGYNFVQIISCIILKKQANDLNMAPVFSLAVSFGVLCVLSGVFCFINMKRSIDLLQEIIIPVAVASLTGLAAILICKLLSPHMGSLVTIIVCGVLSFSLYWTALLLTRNIKERELDVLPSGKLLFGIGQLLRVF